MNRWIWTTTGSQSSTIDSENGYRDKERVNQPQRDTIVIKQHRVTSGTQSTNFASVETKTTENGNTTTDTLGVI